MEAARWLRPEWTKEWEGYLLVELNLSERTIPVYRCALRCFREFLTSDGKEHQALHGTEGQRALRSYLRWLRTVRDLDSGTTHLYFRALSNYFQWLIHEELWEWANPIKGIKLPKLDADHRDLLTNEQATALFNACWKLSDPWDPWMARACVALLLGDGLRNTEARLLPLEDVQAKRIVLRDQKNRAESILYIPRRYQEVHREWRSRRQELVRGVRQPPDNYLLLRPEHPIGREGINKMIRRLIHASGLPGLTGVTAHAFRHVAITSVARTGNLKEAKEFARHASIKTTERYVHLDDLRTQTILDQAADLVWKEARPAQIALPFEDLSYV